MSSSGLGAIDLLAIAVALNTNETKSRGKYKKYSSEDRYKIGKYASENGPAASARHFKKKFLSLNESTVREFKKLYESEIKSALKQKRDHSKELLSARRGRPLLLGEIDSMVQRYLIATSNRGSIISRAIATSTAKALMSKHPDLVGNIDAYGICAPCMHYSKT